MAGNWADEDAAKAAPEGEAGLRVLVVAADPLVRAGLARLLDEAGCTVSGQVATLLGPDHPAREAAIYRPEVVLWDLGWNAAAALEGTLDDLAALAESGLPVVALLPDEDQAAAVRDAGARGLLLRDAGPAALVAALRAAAQGLLILDPSLAPGAAPSPGSPPPPQAPDRDLTPRESQVLQLLADGLTNRAIAAALGISEHTVKFHVNSLLGKLGAQSRTEAVVRASRLGLLLL